MDARQIAQELFDNFEPSLLWRLGLLPKRSQDAVIRRLVYLVDNIDTGPADRDEIVDDAPHARPRQVEGLLDTGMFDFGLAGSNPA